MCRRVAGVSRRLAGRLTQLLPAPARPTPLNVRKRMVVLAELRYIQAGRELEAAHRDLDRAVERQCAHHVR